MDLHPFSPERRLGHVYEVEGSFADVSFSAANKLPSALFGEYLGRGEVGEFVLIDVGGCAIFGRLLSVGTTASRADEVDQGERSVAVEGRVQLLSSLALGGTSTRGIAKYPKVGDAVYAASSEAILSVIGTAANAGIPSIHLGRLSVDESVPVDVPLARLFGRHLAIVGATGSGKSWTLGHIAESVAGVQGKLILIDATGEFRTLGDRATHLAFSSDVGEPTGTTLVGLPHYMMRETDRNAFLSPSSGTQLPKLREAVRSLRLARAISADPAPDTRHAPIVAPNGQVPKSGGPISVFQGAVTKYISHVEGANSVFDIRQLASQVQHECIWPTGQGGTSSQFGGVNNTELGYVSSLISRINDLLQTPEIMDVIDPPAGVANVIEEITTWLGRPDAHVLRISLKSLTYANHLREIVVNILGQSLLATARTGAFGSAPLVVAIDEAISSLT